MADQQERDRLMLDLVIIHQLLLERFKLHQTGTFNKVLRDAARTVRLLLARIEYDTLRDMPRRELNQLVKTLGNLDVFAAHTEEQKAVLKRLSYIETATQQRIVSAVTKKKLRTIDPETVWTFTRNEPLAASFLLGALDDFKKHIGSLFAKLVHNNYVAGSSVATLKREIIGSSPQRYRDGLLAKLKRQSDALTNTVIQHVSSIANEKVSALAYTNYEWVAMLDSATCDVCQGLHGQIFKLGEGPRPPRHYNCQCDMIPIEGASRVTPPLNEWLDAQSPKFRRELNRPLSLSEYEEQLAELGE